MFFVFLARTRPAQSMAKPVCMKKTSTAAMISHIASAAGEARDGREGRERGGRGAGEAVAETSGEAFRSQCA
jgi:hypothetical protein